MFNVGDRVKWGKVGGYSWMLEPEDFYGVVKRVDVLDGGLKVSVENYDESPIYAEGLFAKPSWISKVEPISLENK